MIYALKEIDEFRFICVSRSKKELSLRINAAFYNWLGMQPRATEKTREDFLKDYHLVKMTIKFFELK